MPSKITNFENYRKRDDYDTYDQDERYYTGDMYDDQHYGDQNYDDQNYDDQDYDYEDQGYDSRDYDEPDYDNQEHDDQEYDGQNYGSQENDHVEQEPVKQERSAPEYNNTRPEQPVRGDVEDIQIADPYNFFNEEEREAYFRQREQGDETPNNPDMQRRDHRLGSGRTLHPKSAARPAYGRPLRRRPPLPCAAAHSGNRRSRGLRRCHGRESGCRFPSSSAHPAASPCRHGRAV